MKKSIIVGILVALIIVLMLTVEEPTAYGEMWGRHITNTTINAQNVYVNVTGLQAGELNYVTFTNNKLIIEKEGTYSINGQFSFSDGGNTEFHLALGVNGNRQEHCHTERKIGSGGDVGSASYTCIDTFNATDELTVMVENADNTNNPEIHSINMNIREI